MCESGGVLTVLMRLNIFVRFRLEKGKPFSEEDEVRIFFATVVLFRGQRFDVGGTGEED